MGMTDPADTPLPAGIEVKVFDALMDLIGHKIHHAIKHGGKANAGIQAKEERFRQFLTARETIAEHTRLLADLETTRMEIEQSDDRCYTNGRIARIDAEIALQRDKIIETKKLLTEGPGC